MAPMSHRTRWTTLLLTAVFLLAGCGGESTTGLDTGPIGSVAAGSEPTESDSNPEASASAASAQNPSEPLDQTRPPPPADANGNRPPPPRAAAPARWQQGDFSSRPLAEFMPTAVALAGELGAGWDQIAYRDVPGPAGVTRTFCDVTVEDVPGLEVRYLQPADQSHLIVGIRQGDDAAILFDAFAASTECDTVLLGKASDVVAGAEQSIVTQIDGGGDTPAVLVMALTGNTVVSASLVAGPGQPAYTPSTAAAVAAITIAALPVS